MHSVEIPIAREGVVTGHASPVVELPIETRLVLFRALSDYCKPQDEEGFLTETFIEWQRNNLSAELPRDVIQAMIAHKIQALKLNHQNYTMTLRPQVAAFIEQSEQQLRDMAVPILLDLRETLKKSLNGHAR